jgi:hypothetical protein
VPRPATTFLVVAGFALALVTVVLRGAGSEIGAEVDALLRRNRALDRSIAAEGALVEELRAPARVAERIAAFRRHGRG